MLTANLSATPISFIWDAYTYLGGMSIYVRICLVYRDNRNWVLHASIKGTSFMYCYLFILGQSTANTKCTYTIITGIKLIKKVKICELLNVTLSQKDSYF